MVKIRGSGTGERRNEEKQARGGNSREGKVEKGFFGREGNMLKKGKSPAKNIVNGSNAEREKSEVVSFVERQDGRKEEAAFREDRGRWSKYSINGNQEQNFSLRPD